MGLDTCIYLKLTRENPRLEWDLPRGWSIRNIDHNCSNPEGATHGIETNGERYYGYGYERGPWPIISGALMTLINSPDVEIVWYCSDSAPSSAAPISKRDIADYNNHYMDNGARPYCGEWEE